MHVAITAIVSTVVLRHPPFVDIAAQVTGFSDMDLAQLNTRLPITNMGATVATVVLYCVSCRVGCRKV